MKPSFSRIIFGLPVVVSITALFACASVSALDPGEVTITSEKDCKEVHVARFHEYRNALRNEANVNLYFNYKSHLSVIRSDIAKTEQKESFNAWIEQVGSYQKKIVRLSEPLGLSCFFDRKVDRWHGLAIFEILDPVGKHGYVMVDSVGGAISGVSLERHGLDVSIFEKP